MRRPLRAAGIASLALHLVMFDYLSRRISPKSEGSHPISVEFRDSPGGSAAPKGPRPPRPAARARPVPLKALIPRLTLNPPAHQDFTQDPYDRAASGDSGLAFASDSGSLTARESNFVMDLWRMVDQYIEENPFLSEYNQTGKVSLRFEIDDQGRLTTIQASASNRVLKVIAARAVRKAVLNETGDIRFPARKMRISADFHWASLEACQTLRGHSGRSLSFCHYAENKRRNFSTGERIGSWAGAMINHGPWAYEEIQEYNRQESRRKSQFNPFRKYELDPDWNL